MPAARAFRLLLVSALVALALAAPGATRAAGPCTAEAGWPAADAALAAAVVELTNAHRATLGLAPLRVSPTLSAAATWKAQHMAHGGYLAHDDPAPGARSWSQRLADCGYAHRFAGENVAMGYPTAESVLAGWLASDGHRRNIETAGFGAIGVGAARAANGRVYWAQNFGVVVDAAPAPAPAPVPAAVPPAPAPAPAPAEPASPAPAAVERLAVEVAAATRGGGLVYVSVPTGGDVRLVLTRGRRVVGAARLSGLAGGTTAVSLSALARRLAPGRYVVTASHDGRTARIAFRVR